ncbi:hypothetical protein GO685_03975 [Wolbachia endosymbiont of Madathamugadia hiepei]|uniref:hypothetical protein n=1 Tax=Wolbachia endosymbiont of Madathamugadia hiepei TaxID=1241303 RepID=UPI00158B5EB4|nr:hypothetical protein [Wolbachia endosymbiont of Madathamugadia hiepei]NUX01628.1 hypothetical protein [Wolbachia endosymbiont of Madathamugadia hiepei]
MYTTLYDLSTKLVKVCPCYNSVELNCIPNVSEISQLLQDVENVEQELIVLQKEPDKNLNLSHTNQVFSGSTLSI